LHTSANRIAPLVALVVLVAPGACNARSHATEATSVDAGATHPPAATPSHPAIALAAREGPPSHLVVLLHGVGADADSFQDIGVVLGADLPHADFLVPDGFHPWDGGGRGRQWFSLAGVTDESRAARVRDAGLEVSRWIDGELANRNLGGDRLAVVGFSQGAMVAAWLAVHRTPRPAAVVMLSGLVAESEAPVGSGPTPVLMAHGDRDARIPVSSVEPGARSLEAWGARVTKRIYPGLGHQVGGAELRDVAVFLKDALGAT
jgi:phospholipase/carboxylesterase